MSMIKRILFAVLISILGINLNSYAIEDKTNYEDLLIKCMKDNLKEWKECYQSGKYSQPMTTMPSYSSDRKKPTLQQCAQRYLPCYDKCQNIKVEKEKISCISKCRNDRDACYKDTGAIPELKCHLIMENVLQECQNYYNPLIEKANNVESVFPIINLDY